MSPEIQAMFEKKVINGRDVLVALVPMTQKQSREAYPYRPYSKYAESRFGGNEMHDDFVMVMNDFAIRCKMCTAPTSNQYLVLGVCPDCDGRSESKGVNPHK